MVELMVILKDEKRTYKEKFLIYQTITTSESDPQIIKCIEQARKNFEGEPENIQIKIHMEL